jgi:hypothetical protein
VPMLSTSSMLATLLFEIFSAGTRLRHACCAAVRQKAQSSTINNTPSLYLPHACTTAAHMCFCRDQFAPFLLPEDESEDPEQHF